MILPKWSILVLLLLSVTSFDHPALAYSQVRSQGSVRFHASHCASHARRSQTRSQRRQARRLAAVNKPNLDIGLYRRCYTTEESPPVRLSALNTPYARMEIRRLDLTPLTPDSKAMAGLAKRIHNLDVQSLALVRSWVQPTMQEYADTWAETEVRLTRIPAGIYLVLARAGAAEKRTWFAVTNVALLAKRSRQKLLVFAAMADSGRPVAQVRLRAVDESGREWHGLSAADGTWTAPVPVQSGGLWIQGDWKGNPAFVLSGLPTPPDPFRIYGFTDRPIYRPGQLVSFKAAVRERLEADAPGGFTYRPFPGRKVGVEIRDPTDALVYQHSLLTNRFGSLDGQFQLGPEPPLGSWQLVLVIGEFRAYVRFDVQAYRKPEMTATVLFQRSHYLGGTTIPAVIQARYFFGQPVVNANVKYSVVVSGGERSLEGSGKTDITGQLKIDIPTQHNRMTRSAALTATITDLSRRTVSASGEVLITAAAFRLSVETDLGQNLVGDSMKIKVHASDYDDKPVSTALNLTVSENEWIQDTSTYRAATILQKDLKTDEQGNAECSIVPGSPGSLLLSADALDSGGNAVHGESSSRVIGNGWWGEESKTLALQPLGDTYRSGQAASILVITNLLPPSIEPAPVGLEGEKIYPEAWALVTVEGERLYRQEVIHLKSRSTMLKVPLDEREFPAVSVHVTIVQNQQIYDQQVQIPVVRDDQKLKVTLIPDKTTYSPGETSRWTVTTRDYRDRPVQAEVALGVVDASIYDIAPDPAPDIEGFFYPPQELRVETDFSFAGQYSGGGFQKIPSPGSAGGDASVRVRSKFVDTAFWRPTIATRPDGTGQIAFTMPDNLTTWRATAHGMTMAAAVGQTTNDVIVSMPLLVRLELPRFYVQDDRTTVSAVIQNYSGASRTVHARIEGTGAALEGASERTIEMAPGDQKRLDWNARIQPNQSDIPQDGQAKFRVVADAGQGARDAMELTLPIAANGQKMVDVESTSLTVGRWTQELSKCPAGATVSLTLAPSIASTMLDALNDLQTAPYGSAEETMSSFMPDAVVRGTLRKLGVQRKVDPHLDAWVTLALQKLYRYQHADGGWQWWEFDETDGDMTAYILWGLGQARAAGVPVDQQRIDRGAAALRALLGDEKELGKRAEWMYTLASVCPGKDNLPLSALFDKREKLTHSDRASLCLALAEQAKHGGKQKAASLLRMAVGMAHELEQEAVVRGRTAHWPGELGDYSWRSDPAAVTAHVLRALLAAAPNSKTIQPAVQWLMDNRTDKSWSSTRATAEAVIALGEYLQHTGELHPNFHVTASLDGNPVSRWEWSAANASTPATLVLKLGGHHILTLDKVGAGILYVTRAYRYVIPASQARPLNRGILVRRKFTVTAEDPLQAGTLWSGSDIDVQVDIDADAEYRYVVIEDPIPAGCEVQSSEDDLGRFGYYSAGWTGNCYARQEVRDDRVVFLFDRLARGGSRIHYRLHAETPGLYSVLPSTAFLAYTPEVRGNSGLVAARIEDQPGG